MTRRRSRRSSILLLALLLLTSAAPFLPLAAGDPLNTEDVGQLSVVSVTPYLQGHAALWANATDQLTVTAIVQNTGQNAINNFSVLVTGTFSNAADVNQGFRHCFVYSPTPAKASTFLKPGASLPLTFTAQWATVQSPSLRIKVDASQGNSKCQSPGFSNLAPSASQTLTRHVPVGTLPDLAATKPRVCEVGGACGHIFSTGQSNLTFRVTAGDAPRSAWPFGSQVKDPSTNASIAFNVTYVITPNASNPSGVGQTFQANRGTGALGQVDFGTWNLFHRSGSYTVTMIVDSSHDIRDANRTNNTIVTWFRVVGPDLVPDLTVNNSRVASVSPAAGGTPYPGDTSTTVQMNVTVRNEGAGNFSAPGGAALFWNLTMDPGVTGVRHLYRTADVTNFNITRGGARQFTFQFPVDPQSTSSNDYVLPGEHIIQVTLDPQNKVAETNDSNNVATLPIYVADTVKPTIRHVDLWNGTKHVADGSSLSAGSNLTVTALITENSLYLQDVVLHLTAPDGTTQDIPMASTFYASGQYNFSASLARLTQPGDYSLQVTAVDPSGNVATPVPRTFTLTGWNVTASFLDPADNATIGWISGGYDLTVNASIDGTGYGVSDPTGKGVYWVDPNGIRHPAAGSLLLHARAAQSQCSSPVPPATLDCAPDHFYRGGITLDTTGSYLVTIAVQDAAGVYHNVTETVHYEPSPPAFSDVIVPTARDAGKNVVVQANITAYRSSFPVNVTFINFTHQPDGAYVNVSLPLTNGSITGEGTYGRTLTTGFGGDLPWAGTYRWTIVTDDSEGNWNNVTGGLLVNDTAPPSVETWGVSPATQQVGGAVLFFARATDDTAFTANVTISKDQHVVAVLPLQDSNGDGRYTNTTNFTTPGTYQFLILLRDSAGETVSENGTFNIAGNLAPFVTPASGVLVNQTDLVVGPRPVLKFTLSDPDKVDVSSIHLLVDHVDEAGNFTLDPASDATQVNVTYAMDRTFPQGTTFPVNLTVRDDSAVRLLEQANFTVHVDAVPPVTAAPVFSPRYRSGGDLYNVSFHTLWTFSAADNVKGPSSGVASIHWQLAREAVGTVQTYSGPFHLTSSTPPGKLRDGVYTLTYWSVDKAGNQESPRTLRVRLDLDGPDLTYFPHGRYVNATITDPLGVTNATLHYRVQGTSKYARSAMTLKDGLFRGVLPQAGRGTTIEYFLTATDNLGNVAERGTSGNPFVYTPGNHAPTVTFTNPSTGTNASGTLVIKWNAADPDGDPITQSLEIKLASDSTFHQLAPVGSSARSYSWDTTSVPDGTYDLRLAVSDQQDVTLATVEVVVGNANKVAAPNAPNHPRVEAGHQVLFTVKVLKAASRVTLEIYQGGHLVATQPMHDDGTSGDAVAGDNTYSAVHSFDDGGTYTWRVNVTYQSTDGRVVSKEVAGQGNVNVYLTASQVFQRNLGLWAAVVVLTGAVVGVGAYALRNRWR